MPQTLTEERVDAPIGKVQVFRAGSGDPLVYLHSAGGEPTNPALEELADSFAVTVPVFPGFGESEGIDEIDDMEDAVFHLLDMWELLGLDVPLVVGLSLGGWMAMELATRYPERVGKLVLVNPVGVHIDGEPIAEMFGRTPAELAEMLFADQSHPIAQAMHAMSEFTGDVGRQIEIPIEMVLPMWKAISATAKLGWDTAPTLVVAGARDGLVPPVYAETFAAEIPNARLVVIEGAAHWLPFETPGELAELVREFATAR